MRRLVPLLMILVSLAMPVSADPGTEAEALAEVNQARSSQGLLALSSESQLQSQARGHADEMAEATEVFPGADIYAGGGSIDSLISALMDSPSHRATILGNHSIVGIGTAIGDDGKLYLAMEFGGSAPTTTSSTTTTTQPPQTTTSSTIAVSVPTETSETANRGHSVAVVDDYESQLSPESRVWLCVNGMMLP